MGMFLKAAASLGISEFVVTQLHWFLQDYQQNAFGIGAPTETVEEVTGRAPEDFETIARRYVAASPFVIRGPVGVIREVAGLAAALLARTPNLNKIEARLGVPGISNFALAADSPAWQPTHV
jgi:NAD(P)H dehydrogenase (quinone)